MNYSHVTFLVLNLKKQIKNIEGFLFDTEDEFQKSVASYFNIDLEYLKTLNKSAKKKYVKAIVEKSYYDNLTFMEEKKQEFQHIWDENEKEINLEFEKIFNTKFTKTKNHIAYINLNNVCPRFLDTQSFYVNAFSDSDFLLNVCVHELIHFYWFELFAKEFPDISKSNYEYPNIEWLLSEIAVDPIMYYSKFKKYCKKYRAAYNEFYEKDLDGTSDIDRIRKLYKKYDLITFMHKGLEYYKNKISCKKMSSK